MADEVTKHADNGFESNLSKPKQLLDELDAGDNPDVPFNSADRLRTAQEVMHHAADPTPIDQAKNPTGNVPTVESRTYAGAPSAAAELVETWSAKARTRQEMDRRASHSLDTSEKEQAEGQYERIKQSLERRAARKSA